jgi:hypothetical protein
MRDTMFERRWSLDRRSARLLSLVVVLGGLWQIVAPFLLGFADEQLVVRNAIISGILLVLFAGIGAFGIGRWSSTLVRTSDWLACLTGLWLAISPFVLRYQEIVPAFWSALIVGLVSFVIAGVIASRSRPLTQPSTLKSW